MKPWTNLKLTPDHVKGVSETLGYPYFDLDLYPLLLGDDHLDETRECQYSKLVFSRHHLGIKFYLCPLGDQIWGLELQPVTSQPCSNHILLSECHSVYEPYLVMFLPFIGDVFW